MFLANCIKDNVTMSIRNLIG